MSKIKRVAILLTAVSAALFLFSGCSPQERSGVSRIPQNRPSSWEYTPMSR